MNADESLLASQIPSHEGEEDPLSSPTLITQTPTSNEKMTSVPFRHPPSFASNKLTTSVFVQDDALVWRPAELQSRQHTTVDATADAASVTLSHWPVMDYSIDRHRKEMAVLKRKSVKGPSPLMDRIRSYEPSTIMTPPPSSSSHSISRDSPAVPTTPRNPSIPPRPAKTPDPNPLSVISLSDYENGTLPLRDGDDSSSDEPASRADMTDLPFLHEASILYNLATRHFHSVPYTRAGVVICAVNPHAWIDGMYSEAVRRAYADQSVCHPTKSTRLTSLPPHVYEVSSFAYRGLVTEGQDQSILVSGNTGAGKTETIKILMSHLATFDLTTHPSSDAPPVPSAPLSLSESDEDIETPRKKKKHFRPRKLIRRATSSFRTPYADREEDVPSKHLYSTPEGVPLPPTCASSETFPSTPVPSCTENEPHHDINNNNNSNHSRILQRVLDSNPLLEAFGNARTRRNDNSSRFSKYTRMQFHLKNFGHVLPEVTLAGSACETYLLQKGRVVRHDREGGERNFHIFYQFLASEDAGRVWDVAKGRTAEDFRYLGVPSTDTIEGMRDGDRYEEVRNALVVYGITGEERDAMLRAICLVLQLGNIVFGEEMEGTAGENDNRGGGVTEDGSTIVNLEELERASDIMGVSNQEILEALTTKKVVVAGDEVLEVPLTPAAAKDGCDALAKEIYSLIFDWLVRRINDATCATKNYQHPVYRFGTIGLLDIFGFETFETNHFEQMCVNHANEKLQQKFTQDLFTTVQAEYEEEGIDLCKVDVADNTQVLKLVEGKMGLIDLLNEECIRPNGCDTGFVNKIYANINTNDCPLFKKRGMTSYEFGVNHYAGEVIYDAHHFVNKNNDTMPQDLVRLALKSTNKLLQTEFQLRESSSIMKNPRKSQGTIASLTVWTKFQSQLSSLMTNIAKSDSRYIRCIVPNREKKPLVTDFRFTAEQLRYTGIMSAVTVSRAAFPNRMLLRVVHDRFAILHRRKSDPSKFDRREIAPPQSAPPSRTTPSALKKQVQDLLDGAFSNFDASPSPSKSYLCGKSRVYFRAGALEYLEGERLLFFDSMATTIQSCYRRISAIKFVAIWRAASEQRNKIITETEERTTKKKKSGFFRNRIRAIIWIAKGFKDKRREIRN